MNEESRFELRYKEGNIPWDLGRPDYNLINILKQISVKPCKALDIGCGTGDNVIWLASNGFTVTGTDTVAEAVKMAQKKAKESGVNCEFIKSDFLADVLESDSFDFVFDRGCFHSFDSDAERKQFAENVAITIKKGGIWLSLIGSADDPPRESGPPQRTARNIIDAVEADFEILSLMSGRFDSNDPIPARAWICLMRARGK
jgi:SAM-dependent methyltransferase